MRLTTRKVFFNNIIPAITSLLLILYSSYVHASIEKCITEGGSVITVSPTNGIREITRGFAEQFAAAIAVRPIEHIKFIDVKFAYDAFEIIMKAIKEHHAGLKGITLINLVFTDIPYGADAIFLKLYEALAECTELTEIVLSNFNEGEVCLSDEYIKKIIGKNKRLMLLELSRLGLDNYSTSQFAIALSNHRKITTLNLSNNGIGDEGARSIAPILENNPDLKVLNFDFNYISLAGLEAIAAKLSRHTQLTTFALSSYNSSEIEVGATAAKIISPVLKANKELRVFSFGNHNVGGEGASIIADSLSEHTKLLVFRLHGNNLGSDGIRPIIPLLAKNKLIEELDLSCNKIEDEGAIRLFEQALKDKQVLRELNVANNGIGAAAARVIASFLTTQRRLTSFSIYNNEMPAEALVDIIVSLQSNKNLTDLQLCVTLGRVFPLGIMPEHKVKIFDALKKSILLTNFGYHRMFYDRLEEGFIKRNEHAKVALSSIEKPRDSYHKNALAFLAGHHSRVGVKSRLLALPPYLLQYITELYLADTDLYELLRYASDEELVRLGFDLELVYKFRLSDVEFTKLLCSLKNIESIERKRKAESLPAEIQEPPQKVTPTIEEELQKPCVDAWQPEVVLGFLGDNGLATADLARIAELDLTQMERLDRMLGFPYGNP